MSRPLDKENLRALFSRIMQTHQLKPKDVQKERSNIAYSDTGEFRCERCDRVWRSKFSWVTFDLIQVEIVYRWKMMCKYCFVKYEPTFEVSQLERMFETVVRFYKGEFSNPDINIGRSARRTFREPHMPHLCERCCWGLEQCWMRRFYY